jgi:phosphatidylserine/phosphatidylglycerophosphate/cardiolipin synthase-like enzyme/uncharacterized membrane protein YdjX (TVP38/TMEM64 family)
MQERSSSSAILQPEHNVWRLLKTKRAAFLIDAQNYFAELYRALQQAERQVLILGWDIHSALVLNPDQPKDPAGRTLYKLINDLVRDKPDLEVYILAWDYTTLIYATEREHLQSVKFGWMTDARIHFHFDSEHPLGASHHQKIVVVDDEVAFCGGLDLTIRRWDTPDHEAEHAGRHDPDGKRYAPFHDVQLGVEGEAAQALAELARERWYKATGKRLEPPQAGTRHKYLSGALDARLVVNQVRLGISRTLPRHRLSPACLEVQNLYLDLISSAKDWIYFENQYLTADRLVQALSDRLASPEAPECVLILPKKAGGWLEEYTMGLMQNAAVRTLKKADRYGRLRVYYAEHFGLKGEAYITIHSKVMIVDGQWARVGSSNMNHRSMGLDTECDCVLDVSGHAAAQDSVRFFLASLLADHTGITAESIVRRLEEESSLLAVVDEIQHGHADKALVEVQVDERAAALGRNVAEAELIDMEKPAAFEENLDYWAFLQESLGRKEPFSKRNRGVLVTALLAVAAAVAVGVSPLRDFASPGQLAAALNAIGSSREVYVGAFVLFALSGVLFIPLNLLIIVAATVFPTWQALALIMLGTIGSAASGYFLGRLVSDNFFNRHFDQRVHSVLDRIRRGGLWSIIFVRIVPVAPHALINLTAGFCRLKLWQFLLGTGVGALPGSLTLVFLQKSLIEVIRNFSIGSLVSLLAILSVLVGLYVLIRTRFSRYVESSS